MDFAKLVDDLSRPEAYPWPAPSVTVIETHISWVFLAGERVVKLKRPVDLGFVDHTARPDRHRSCVNEVRLNRRFTEDVYLGLASISPVDGRFRIGDIGDIAEGQAPALPEEDEWGVVMRRLPSDRMLDALHRVGADPPKLAARLADRLIPFHLDAGSCESGDPAADCAAMAAVVSENLDQLEPYAGAPLGRTELRLVSEAMRGFIAAESRFLERRSVNGWIREGHGDLRAEHVCLEGDRVQIFDCVEFSRDIRCADVASDLAFLLMDLSRLGLGGVAGELVERYRSAGFDLPDVLLRYYRVHRALVRAKVACMEREGVREDIAHRYAGEAQDYLHIAASQALTVRPALILMTGLSGTGKSSVARVIARACNLPIFASDDVRKQLAGRSGPSPAEWGQGIYSADWTERTYERLHGLAKEALSGGGGALVDATFLDTAARIRFAEVAEKAGRPVILIETVCDPDTAITRIRARAERGGTNSDANEEIYHRQRQALNNEPPGIPAGAIVVSVDTTDDELDHLEPVFVALAKHWLVSTALLSDANQERTPRR